MCCLLRRGRSRTTRWTPRKLRVLDPLASPPARLGVGHYHVASPLQWMRGNHRADNIVSVAAPMPTHFASVAVLRKRCNRRASVPIATQRRRRHRSTPVHLVPRFMAPNSMSVIVRYDR